MSERSMNHAGRSRSPIAAGAIVEQRQRQQRQRDAEHAEPAGALAQQRERQRDGEAGDSEMIGKIRYGGPMCTA